MAIDGEFNQGLRIFRPVQMQVALLDALTQQRILSCSERLALILHALKVFIPKARNGLLVER